MLTHQEQYFHKELKSIKPEEEMIIASGYFRSYLSKQGLASIVEAIAASGYFLALTASNIYIVKTRASSSTSPILENKGVQCISLAKVNEVIIDSKVLVIEHEAGVLPFELVVKNKYFPSNQNFLDILSDKFNLGINTEDILSEKKKSKLLKLGLIIGTITIGILLVKFN